MAIHRLGLAEQRVLASFISGRLPAGQVHSELERARMARVPAADPAPAMQAVPAVAA